MGFTKIENVSKRQKFEKYSIIPEEIMEELDEEEGVKHLCLYDCDFSKLTKDLKAKTIIFSSGQPLESLQ